MIWCKNGWLIEIRWRYVLRIVPLWWKSLLLEILSFLIDLLLLSVNEVICCQLLFLSHPHKRSWLVLLSHHFDSFLSAVEVEFIILFFIWILSLNAITSSSSVLVFIWLWHSSSFVSVTSSCSRFHAWQRKFVFRWDSWHNSWLVPPISHIGSSLCSLCILIDISNTVLHEYQMCILVWSLLSLSLLYSPVQEVDSLVILFFKFGLDALVLNILQLIHM